MISFLDPSEQTPPLGPTKFITKETSNDAHLALGVDLTCEKMAVEVHKKHLNHTTQKIQEALIARFGEMPSLQEIARHCHCFFDTQNVAHYCWLDEPPKLGDKIDPANVLCVIAPPKFGPFGAP